MTPPDSIVALCIALVSLIAALFFSDRRAACPRGWFMSEPGICQRITPEKWTRGPRGGWMDLSEPGERVGIPLHCTGGSQLRQDGNAAWCQR